MIFMGWNPIVIRRYANNMGPMHMIWCISCMRDGWIFGKKWNNILNRSISHCLTPMPIGPACI